MRDRYEDEGGGTGVDVLMPIKGTPSPLLEMNLLSIYREIPVNRLLIGDAGGGEDGSLAPVLDFPRVWLIDQREHKTLGYCLRELIEDVRTSWFVYLHSDVYLPPGWYDEMAAQQDSYDWMECNRRKTLVLDYPLTNQDKSTRAYSGSQMGRKAAFNEVLPLINDDDIYRSEDIVLRHLVERFGGRYGRVGSTYHNHQQTISTSGNAATVQTLTMQARSLIRYTDPTAEFAHRVDMALMGLERLGALDPDYWRAWTADTRLDWREAVEQMMPTSEPSLKDDLRDLRNIVGRTARRILQRIPKT
jgi:hypothetical protein